VDALEKERVTIDGQHSEQEYPAGEKHSAGGPLGDGLVGPRPWDGHADERTQLPVHSIHGEQPGNIFGADSEVARYVEFHRESPGRLPNQEAPLHYGIDMRSLLIV